MCLQDIIDQVQAMSTRKNSAISEDYDKGDFEEKIEQIERIS